MPVTGQTPMLRDALIGACVDGRYRIQRVHGRGGMSVIYAGMHEQQQREVAIKVLDDSLASDPEAVRRFVYEARTASSISHGHVVGVSDFGRLPDGRPYLVMPMIAGGDMATLLANEGPLAPRRVAALLSGVASALDAMHARGLVHRDIKSENLMHIRGDDGAETALVLDFGIAAEGLGGSSAQADADGSGTPEFMAPEVLSGQLADARSDVYSLGTVAFELMTGCLPFEGDELPELLRNKAAGKQRTLTQAAGIAFPPALEAVLARALALAPEGRQRTCGQLVRDLRAAAAQMPDVRMRPSARIHRPARSGTLVGTGMSAHAEATAGAGVRASRSTHRNWQLPADPSPSPDLSPDPSPNPTPNPTPNPDPSPSPNLSPNPTPNPSPSPNLSPTSGSNPPPARTDRAARDFAAASVEDTLRPPPELDVTLANGADRVSPLAGRWPKYAGIAAVVVLALVIWTRAQPRLAQVESEPAAKVEATTQAAAPARPPQPDEVIRSAAETTAASAETRPAAPAVRPETTAADRVRAPASAGARKRAGADARAEHAATPVLAPEPAPAPAPEPRPASSAPARDTARAEQLTRQATDSMLGGDFASARVQYQRAIQADPRHAPAHRGKALLLERMGRREEAAKAFQRFLQLSPHGAGADKIRARLEALEAAP